MGSWLDSWREWLWLGVLLGLLTVPTVINKRKPAVSTVAWVLALVFVPYLGLLCYLFFGDTRLARRLRKRRRASDKIAGNLGELKEVVRARRLTQGGALEELPPLAQALASVARQLDAAPLSSHNHVELLEDGAAKFPLLMARLEAARHHIHLLYYIFETDETGTALRDLLVRKAREGVEVRLLWDAVGSHWAAHGFFDALEAAGGRHASFLPVRLTLRRLDLNFRNHRKVVVIDGACGFTGGMNVGNEYSGLHVEGWHDLHLLLEGPAVHDLQEVFAEDWFFATGEDLASARYFPSHRRPGDEVVQIVSSGPDHEWPALHQLFFAAITGARERVLIMTPYFVPTEPLLMALIVAAQRGVEVRLLLPARSDQPLAWWAGRSYYPELLQAGVRIFEHTRSILHGKAMSVDGCFGTVGSTNMDVRSFYLNFELNALVYSTPFATALEALIRRDMAQAQEITSPEFKLRPWRWQLAENACRLLSPML
jgi:cardiolipin synthase